MEKIAQKVSSDPVQQKLRDTKKLWNKRVSEFINDIIHTKKLINGAPSKFFPQKSNIKNEIPADPHTIINSLAGDFQDITSEANKIIQQQIDYSKNRRKSIPKTDIKTETPNPSNELSKQLAPGLADLDYDLIVEGSNPLSRFFTRLTTPTMGISEKAKLRRLRITLLNKSAELNRELKKFQIQIVKRSPQSIHQASHHLTLFWNNWRLVFNELKDYKNKFSPNLPDPEPENEAIPEDVKSENVKQTVLPALNEKIKLIQEDVDYASPHPTVLNVYVSDLESLKLSLDAYDQALPEDKIELANAILEQYKSLLQSINSEKQTSFKSLKEAVMKLLAFQGTSNKEQHLETTAQAFLKRWLGKTKHQLMPMETTHLRLKILEKSEVMRSDVNKIMDLLEKGFDITQLYPIAVEVNNQLSYIRSIMRPLHNITEKEK